MGRYLCRLDALRQYYNRVVDRINTEEWSVFGRSPQFLNYNSLYYSRHHTKIPKELQSL